MVDAVRLKSCVIVAGHPRSGTSLACQIVESAGVDFPSDFEGDEYNTGGYYEMERAKEVSKRLMDSAMTDEVTRDMNRIVRRLNEHEGTSGMKIVRVPALFFYRHIAKDLKLVLVYRHPADVKASLFKRGISEFPVSWVKNNNALIAAYENVDRSIVLDYQSLIDRAEHVRSGFDALDLDVDLDVVSRDQQTQVRSRVHVTRDERELYEQLQALEEESCTPESGGWFG